MTNEEKAIEILRRLPIHIAPPFDNTSKSCQIELNKDIALDMAIKALEQQEDIKKWLSSFNTGSATECFTAVNNLKEKINGK